MALRSLPLLVLALLAALLLPMPASAGKKDGEKSAARMELVRDHLLGEPVERVRFLRPMHAYEIAGERAIVVWETPHKAWLVDLRDDEACRHLDRDHTIVVSTFRDSLNTANGVVTSTQGVYCRMERIQEIDVPAWRKAEREAGLRG